MAGEIELSDIRTLTHVLGHDAQGLFGRAPIGKIAAPRSFNIVAALGDSTVQQMHLDSTVRNRATYNHFFIGNALSGNRIARAYNFGVSGERTDQTLARLPAALATDAGVLYISEGVNSIAQAPYTHAVSGLTVSAATVGASAFADTQTKVDAALALGLRVIVVLCHGATNYTAAQIKQLVIYNAALRRLAELRQNVWLLDAPAILHDPATSPTSLVFRTGYMRLGEATIVHEATTGAYFVGKAFARILSEVMRLLPRNSVDGSNQRVNGQQLMNNPFFNATTGNAGTLGAGGSLAAGTSAVPREWLFNRASGDTTTTFTVGVEPNADGNGNDVVITYNVTTAGGGVRVVQDLAGTSPNGDYWVPDTVLQGFSKISVAAGSTGIASVQTSVDMNGTLNGTSTTLTTHALLGDLASGLLPSTEGYAFEHATEQIQVPAYSARAYLSFRALNLLCGAPGTGTVRLNMPQLNVISTLVA
ncbi:GDSL-like lipase/acylhydrolase family protein [Rhizobium sp. PP-F2F-G48]|uniref:SGNH/GDSL hydrolase family protein n=1 Tax=Rhizobium sp. PP-F2F-G48 TaxID=2135651 RepID=UPI00104F6275|nr:SGNH/GDSL hydrolase family protein [Rhizobium sp. PP-F2F-G48]TCM57766.1 GDSL-like lipase/acylhydrolase family protein [Rhizobium sp. PP-F2F-G48]